MAEEVKLRLIKIDEKDEIFDRKNAQGSVFDKTFFTDDQLKQGAEINNKAAAGEISWDSAHNWWENTRAGYGYSGGEDGHGYTTLANKAKENTPSYINQYQGAINQAANALMNRGPFTYDHNTDPTYQQYADSYTRQGQQAMQDTLAQVSARTGGLASSYAGTAAQQTYNGYMAALADKVPELRQLAYQMYMDEGDTMRQNLQMLQGLDNTAYGRYRDSVADNQWQQNYDRGVFESDRQFNYDKAQDDKKWKWDEDGREHDRNREATQDAQTQVRDHIAAGGKVEELPPELIAASGYSPAQWAAWEKEYADAKSLAAAQLMEGTGDYSRYKELWGLTDEEVAALVKRDQEQNAPKVTGGGGYTPKPSAPDYEGLFAAAQASGYPKSYIANNYKNFGFTSSTGLYDEFGEWDGGAEPEDDGTWSGVQRRSDREGYHIWYEWNGKAYPSIENMVEAFIESNPSAYAVNMMNKYLNEIGYDKELVTE